jgi:hypothetical protein
LEHGSRPHVDGCYPTIIAVAVAVVDDTAALFLEVTPTVSGTAATTNRRLDFTAVAVSVVDDAAALFLKVTPTAGDTAAIASGRLETK